MKKALVLACLLATHCCIYPEVDLQKIVDKIGQKNIECGIGVIISLLLLKNNKGKLSNGAGIVLLVASLGLYVSTYKNASDAFNTLYAQITK